MNCVIMCARTLPALIKRFDTVTLALWKKHGIRRSDSGRLIGSRTRAHYMLAWESLAEREQKWNGSWPIRMDRQRADRKDGPIIASSQPILQPTSFSA